MIRKPGRMIIVSHLFQCSFAAMLLTGILDRTGLFSGELQLHTLYSFTTISDLFVLALTIITEYNAIQHPQYSRPMLAKLRYIGLIMILITGLIYHFILLPQKIVENPDYQVFTYGNIMAHYIALLGLLFGYLFERTQNIWVPIAFHSFWDLLRLLTVG